MLQHDIKSLWVLIVMPIMIFTFAYKRSHAVSEASEFAGPLKKVVIELTSEACSKFNVLSEYEQRPQSNELFIKFAEERRQSVIPEQAVSTNNDYFPKLL